MSKTVVTIIVGEAGSGKTYALTELLRQHNLNRASYVDVNYLQQNNTYTSQA